MVFTSAEANKELRKLSEELDRLLKLERQSSTFTAAVTEDVESARPAYNFLESQEKIQTLEEKIRRLKHAINVFNTAHQPEGYDMTVDEMLVYIPQLSARKKKYAAMADRLEKTRKENIYGRSTIIEYEYVNYSLEEARYCLEDATRKLSNAQLALDRLNNSATFEIDI